MLTWLLVYLRRILTAKSAQLIPKINILKHSSAQTLKEATHSDHMLVVRALYVRLRKRIGPKYHRA